MDVKIQHPTLQHTIDSLFKKETTEDIKKKADNFNKYLISDKKIEKTTKVKTLEQWVLSLEELKKNLEENVSRENLDTYKEAVKKFLDNYVQNDIYLKEHMTRSGLVLSKKIESIKVSDEKIDKLTNNLLLSQLGRLEVVKLAGELQGLLFELIV